MHQKRGVGEGEVFLIGTIDGENYYNGEEIKPMPEKVKFKVDNGYYNCDVRLESYVLLE